MYESPSILHSVRFSVYAFVQSRDVQRRARFAGDGATVKTEGARPGRGVRFHQFSGGVPSPLSREKPREERRVARVYSPRGTTRRALSTRSSPPPLPKTIKPRGLARDNGAAEGVSAADARVLRTPGASAVAALSSITRPLKPRKFTDRGESRASGCVRYKESRSRKMRRKREREKGE